MAWTPPRHTSQHWHVTKPAASGRKGMVASQARGAAEAAYDIATQRYRAGLSGYLTVLSAESAVLNQRRQSVDLQARALSTQVALVRALGGGFAPADVVAQAAAR